MSDILSQTGYRRPIGAVYGIGFGVPFGSYGSYGFYGWPYGFYGGYPYNLYGFGVGYPFIGYGSYGLGFYGY